ncbi:hypothetical protein L3X38_018342 [Prunus dulcis]|uniref:FAR1 domain-containing protein n=1 Tax=Prunus dulcis TaxID=3755 RepID=A0AAD4ZAM9_PRUDU|nr:hypothetical protein L3X38_018342 [Prunus dulcis]
MRLVKTCKENLQLMRDNEFEELVEQASSFCYKHDITVLTMDEEYVIPGSSRRNAPMKTNYHGYRVEIFIHVIYGQLAELNDHFNEVEEIIQVENGETSTPKNKMTQLKAPYAGMVFETMEEARNYYEEYGRQEGFWLRTRSCSKTRRHLDMVTNRQFVCAHEGKYVPKNTSQKASEENDERDISEIENMKRTGKNYSTVKCGCKASMRIKLDRWSNKWKVRLSQSQASYTEKKNENEVK